MLGPVEFSPTGWMACYESGSRRETLPVDGWEADTGAALVVDPSMGNRTMASHRKGFVGLEQAEKVVTAAPADHGWRVRLADGGTESGYFVEPVAVWLVTESGAAFPLLAKGPDNFAEIPPAAQEYYILAPGDEDTEGLKPA